MKAGVCIITFAAAIDKRARRHYNTDMVYKTKFWIILFSALFVLGCGAFLLLRAGGGAGTTARIWLDGEVIREIDLAAVAAPFDFELESKYGVNTVHVEHGSIAISAADCPDGLCVAQGAISSSAIPIVCMPHRLVIEIGGAP